MQLLNKAIRNPLYKCYWAFRNLFCRYYMLIYCLHRFGSHQFILGMFSCLQKGHNHLCIFYILMIPQLLFSNQFLKLLFSSESNLFNPKPNRHRLNLYIECYLLLLQAWINNHRKIILLKHYQYCIDLLLRLLNF
jgi:hypothetical protein